jgi:hypothetical protein
MRSVAGAEVEQIIYRMAQILFALEVALHRLNGCVAQQELNCSTSPPLVWHSLAQVVRRSCAGRAQVVRSNIQLPLSPGPRGP